MQWNVPLFDIHIDQTDIEAVTQVLASRWLSMGAITRLFEQEFAEQLHCQDAVAVSSGTAALHLAVMALDLGVDDEVIIPSLSFVASAAVVALAGARPVFAEVKSSQDLTIDPEHVAELITPRTRALVVMHYGGYSANMEALLALAHKHGLVVIEDAAHAPIVQGSQGMLGTLSDIGCFSFFSTKNMTTGEGGMIVARDPEMLSKIRMLRSHCMTTSSWEKHKGRASSYDVTGFGLNYRTTDIASALGRVQLQKLAQDRQRRRELVQIYQNQLAQLPEVVIPFANWEGDSAYHLFVIILPKSIQRSMLQAQLKERGIQSSVHYPPTHLFSIYQQNYGYRAGSLPLTENIAERILTLPLHVNLTHEQTYYVADTVCQIVQSC